MKPLIIANWKCNPTTLKAAKGLFNSIQKGLRDVKKAKVVICPPFIYLSNLKISKSQNLVLGVQNVFWEQKGAFTGEISPQMLKDLGCQYVIVGHSERRKHLNETDEMINKKIKALVKAKLQPIFCVGESEEERKKGQTIQILKSQIEKGLKEISRKEIKNIVLTYEPIWAISTSTNRKDCPPEEAQMMSLLLRKILAKKYGRGGVNRTPILYGGNVNSKNIRLYIDEAQMDGVLVGGASLGSKEFLKIVKIARG